MVFTTPEWVPQMPFEIPDSLSIGQFMQNEKLRPIPATQRRHPFTCGLTGVSYSHGDLFSRSEKLARSLAKAHGWNDTTSSPWEKVVCIFSLNSIDYLTVAHATHRLSGIVTPANAAYTVEELTHQLVSSGSKVLFTCASLLKTARKAAQEAGLARESVYLIQIPDEEKLSDQDFITLDRLMKESEHAPPLEPLTFMPGQGAQQTAFLCYSSGTSGQPKAVKISHYNVIANIVQQCTYESVGRRAKGVKTQVLLAPLPMSHIYALVVASHAAVWRGDGYVVLPKYDFHWFLEAIQRFKVEQILVVPPILLQMLRMRNICAKYDLSSVRFLFSGAAPLGEETIREFGRIYPKWTIAQAYGMTETSVCVTVPSEHEIVARASGSLLPKTSVKLMGEDGGEIRGLEAPGEILVQSPSVVLGYLQSDKATAETFVEHSDGRWVRTGDIGLFTLSPSGNEQLVVVDRIKELIKVMGHQVAPAELEAHLLAHTAVADCAVIQVPDPKAGEVPKAFVVPSAAFHQGDAKNLARLGQELSTWVTDHKSAYKALRGGVEFLDAIPKSPSGKILRRNLRERERRHRASLKARM
ncbi:hypothetical protein NU219Hw_g1518t1 [Hortaea werneckii]